jgi:hypothetical protein
MVLEDLEDFTPIGGMDNLKQVPIKAKTGVKQGGAIIKAGGSPTQKTAKSSKADMEAVVYEEEEEDEEEYEEEEEDDYDQEDDNTKTSAK